MQNFIRKVFLRSELSIKQSVKYALFALFLYNFAIPALHAQDSLTMPKLRAGVKVLQLINFLENHREAGFTVDKQLYKHLFLGIEGGFATVKRFDYMVNLTEYASGGYYGKIGCKFILPLDKVLADVCLFYTHSRSREKNVWKFPSSYWQEEYLHTEELRTVNHALAIQTALHYKFAQRFYVGLSGTISAHLINTDNENFKRIFLPGLGYAWKYDWMHKKRFPLVPELNIQAGICF